jgi:glycosyltransferase involved in cell wall biosynthesis
MGTLDLPRVTVVTPSFNQAAFLEQTIDSVLSQGYPNLEYIIVDGGSSDGSVEIIQKYAAHLAWWVSEKDQGQGDALNKGFQRASGELLGWLNSDDLYQPGSILAAVEVFQSHPEAGLVYGDVLSIDAAGQPFNLMRFAPYTLQDLMAFKIICQPGAMLRRSVLEQAGGLDVRYHYVLDHHLWLRMVRLAPMVYLPRTQAAARFHPAAKNLAQASRFGEEALQVAAWLASAPEFAAHYNARRVWGGAYRLNGWYQVEGERPAAALRSYARSLANDPRAALTDWRRIGYAVLAWLGLARIKPGLYRLLHLIRRTKRPDIYRSKKDDVHV